MILRNRLFGALTASVIGEIAVVLMQFAPMFEIPLNKIFGNSQIVLALSKYLPYITFALLGLVCSTLLFFYAVTKTTTDQNFTGTSASDKKE